MTVIVASLGLSERRQGRDENHLYEVLQNTREVLKEDKEIITLRDETYEISRSCELLLDDAKHKLDYEVARRTEEEAEQGAKTSLAAHRLNVLVAFLENRNICN